MSPAKLARAIRMAYALGWRDRGAVDAAVREGALEAPREGADDAPAIRVEDLYVRIAKGA